MSYKIHELCSINAYNLTKNDDWDYIYYLDTANLNEGTISDLKLLRRGIDKIPSRAKRKVINNDILLSTVRPNQKHYGIMKNIPNRLIASTGFAVLTPNEELVYPEYLYGYLTQDKIILFLQAVAETSTSAYPSIKPSVIGELEIELPSLEEQKAIAHILSTLDEKIELNNKINKTLEDMAQAIFNHWFVDFEFPNEDGKPYKSSGGEMVESELGMIPKGWEVITLKDLSLDIVTGKTPSTKNKMNYNGDIPFVKIPDMHGNVYVLKTESYLSRLGSMKNKIVPKNSVMVSCIATPGLVALAAGECQTNQQINTIICKKEEMSYFVFFLLKGLTEYIKALGSTGSATLNLNKGEFSKIKVVMPDFVLILTFYRLVKPFFEMILNNQRIRIQLEKVCDILLPKLISGEIRVPLNQEQEGEEVS